MKLTITIDPEILNAVDAHAWYVNGAKLDVEHTTYQKTERMLADLEREAKFQAEQYLHRILTMYETRPR